MTSRPRGLAHLARLADDLPTAYATAQTLGWAGRHHRVEGDIWWPHGDMHRAAAAYAAARTEAEDHAIAGERATSQAHRALALAFTHPDQAADEIDLAHQLLTGLTLRATTATVQIAELVRDAGATPGIDDRAERLRTEIRLAGVTAAEPLLELALAFHHAIQGSHDKVTGSIARLRELSRGGDCAYYTDIAHFMAGLPLEEPSPARWLDGQQPTRQRWRDLVTTRRDHLGISQWPGPASPSADRLRLRRHRRLLCEDLPRSALLPDRPCLPPCRCPTARQP